MRKPSRSSTRPLAASFAAGPERSTGAAAGPDSANTNPRSNASTGASSGGGAGARMLAIGSGMAVDC
jgi:hypothetical protein